MDPLTAPVEVDPTDARVRDLIETHLRLMYESSPACSVHAMSADSLAGADARFFAFFDGDRAVAMGALKRLSGAHGEVKSMYVRVDWRGTGLASRILSHLMDAAGAAGLTRVSLETGSQAAFAAARAFYERHGFSYCPPFEGYADDPESVFMTRTVQAVLHAEAFSP